MTLMRSLHHLPSGREVGLALEEETTSVVTAESDTTITIAGQTSVQKSVHRTLNDECTIA